MKAIVLLIKFMLLLACIAFLSGLQEILITFKFGQYKNQTVITKITIDSIVIISAIMSLYLLAYIKIAEYKKSFLALPFLLVLTT